MNNTVNNSFAQLGEPFCVKAQPDSIQTTQLLFFNAALAKELQLSIPKGHEAALLSGQMNLNDQKPVAMNYAGHQFGQFNPQLGDGRAHLLGELTDLQGQIKELHLKGSGATPFARRGDGKCGIKPAVREYIMSEAMQALGVPTTRSLSVVLTGETIHREVVTAGAVVSRIALSHIRVGTFEYFAARGMSQEVQSLADFCLQRLFPDIPDNDEKYFNLLNQVIEKQIETIVHWMRVGFIHGVMNTDNMLISGETVDYGPCAMMGVYDPNTVFSSIDHHGRYAYGQQPHIAQWNLARLAESLLPLIAKDEQQAINQATTLIESFQDRYNQAYEQMLSRKIGIKTDNKQTRKLSQELLELMQKYQLDYTQTFVSLHDDLKSGQATTTTALVDWSEKWQHAIKQAGIEPSEAVHTMASVNPRVIPRNHHIETVLADVEASLSTASTDAFLAVLNQPYEQSEDMTRYQDADANADLNYQTFCGT